jgi:hypothetical protein
VDFGVLESFRKEARRRRVGYQTSTKCSRSTSAGTSRSALSAADDEFPNPTRDEFSAVARPYMRARAALADGLISLGRLDEAVAWPLFNSQ